MLIFSMNGRGDVQKADGGNKGSKTATGSCLGTLELWCLCFLCMEEENCTRQMEIKNTYRFRDIYCVY